MLPWSAVWCLDVYDLAGPRASGNVRHAQMLCYVIVERLCEVLLLYLWGSSWQACSLRGPWEKVKMVASTCSLQSLNSQGE